MRIVIEKLRKDYKTISIRPSDLDSNKIAQFNRTELQIEKNFERWERMHQVVWNILVNKDKTQDILNFYSTMIDKKEMKRLYNISKLVQDKQDFILNDYKARCYIECWEYLIIFSWKVDGIYINSEWEYVIVDYKSAVNLRTESEAKERIQLKSYAFLTWIPNIEWRIFTKWEDPDLQIIKVDTDYDIIYDEVLKDILFYVYSNYGYAWYRELYW